MDGVSKHVSADIEAKARLHYPEEGSHGWNHIQDVLANARRMRRRELRRNELAALMYHDSSLMTGDRDTHAEDSAAIARRELSRLFRKRQLEDIVNAIAHHRASYEGSRSSRLEDLVAAADRPVPDLVKQVARSWKYHEELGEPEGLRAENVASHLKEKYGHGGYAYGNAPRLYLKTYGRELRDIMSKFDALTPEAVKSMMSRVEKKAQTGMLYHGSPHELGLLDGTKTRHAPGFVFVSPSKYHASLFALNRRKVVDVLKKQIGDTVKIKGLSYGQWEDESSDKIPDETDVYIETDKPFKPFSGKQKGYVYSVNSGSYLDKIKKWKNDNGDKELLIEGKVKPDLLEEIAIRYNVHPGKAPWQSSTN